VGPHHQRTQHRSQSAPAQQHPDFDIARGRHGDDQGAVARVGAAQRASECHARRHHSRRPACAAGETDQRGARGILEGARQADSSRSRRRGGGICQSRLLAGVGVRPVAFGRKGRAGLRSEFDCISSDKPGTGCGWHWRDTDFKALIKFGSVHFSSSDGFTSDLSTSVFDFFFLSLAFLPLIFYLCPLHPPRLALTQGPITVDAALATTAPMSDQISGARK
jgi:hypothetical protein